LVEAGVKCYEVDLVESKKKYFGDSTSVTTALPVGKLEISDYFDPQAFKDVLHKLQTFKTSFAQFLKEIAEAGICSYQVDMEAMTVTYYGKQPGEKIIEKVLLANLQKMDKASF
jgi:uncharacterized protein YbcV (DUF1398 family)